MAQTEPEMKQRILLAAKKLFAKQGFEGTSVRQICDEAGANVALVSYYFGGKENVFLAVFDRFFVKAAIDRLDEVPEEPAAGLEFILTEIVKFAVGEPDMATILQQSIISNSSRTEHMKEYTFPLWSKVRSLLDEGRRQGVFHFESLDTTLVLIIGAVLGQKKIDYFSPLLTSGDQTKEDYAEACWRFVSAALGLAPRKEGQA